MPDNYVIVADAATQTGYSREYLRRLARDGVIKSKKIGVVMLIHLPDLLKHQQVVNDERIKVGDKRAIQK